MYILSNQVSLLKKDSYIYLYNWFNGVGVSIDKGYIRSVDSKKIKFSDSFSMDNINSLIDNFFISKSGINMNFYKKFFSDHITKEESRIHLILLPAGYLCNFNCKYCYENHVGEIYKENYIPKIMEFIKKFDPKQLSVEYFGGEPLLNYRWIIDFQKKNNNTVASMTTNGYFLDRKKLLSLIDTGVKSYQITLDGMAEDHNALRPTADGKGTWKTIIKNLKDAKTLDKQFAFTIRINFNEKTANNILTKSFFDELNFIKNDPRFRLIFRPISLYSERNGTTTQEKIDVCHRGKKSALLFALEEEAQKAGFLLGDLTMLSNPGGLVCYASKKYSYMISPTLDVLKCTISVDKDFNNFGPIDNIDKNKIFEWSKFSIRFNENCTNCFLFFQCMGRSCALKNFHSRTSVCPSHVDENLMVEKIIRQKQLLKEMIHHAKAI